MKIVYNIISNFAALSHYHKYTISNFVDIFGRLFLIMYVTINSFFIISLVVFLLSNPT